MQNRHLTQISGPERELTEIISQTHSHRHLLRTIILRKQREKHYTPPQKLNSKIHCCWNILYLIKEMVH